jgi:Flp pilus assembly protein TadD
MLDPGNPILWHNSGRAFRRQNMFREAISDYEQSLKLRAQNIETLYDNALAHMNLSELDEVDWYYSEILKIDPCFAGAIGDKETIQVEEGNYKQAVTFFEKALRIEPKNIRVIRNKALALELTGDNSSAEELYNQAMALELGYQ